MKYILNTTVIPMLILLGACGANSHESRQSKVSLPISNVLEEVVYKENPIVEIKNYNNSKILLNSDTIFSMNDTMDKMITFRTHSSDIVNALIQKINTYPKTSKIHIDVYRFGAYDHAYLRSLTENQAQTIAALLWDFGNIAHERLSYSGLGDQGTTIVQNQNASTLLKNNRIEITLS